MNEPTLRRLLGLVEKTGDKVIITDPAGEQPYVLMSLDQYERLVVSEKPTKIAVEETGPAAAAVPVRPTPSKPQAPPWRSKLGLDVVEPPVQELFKNQPRPKLPAQIGGMQHIMAPTAPTNEAAFDAEGEERFYLEPLE